MTINTAAKRISALRFAGGWQGPAIIPDGAISTADRAALLGLYSGLVPANAYTIVNTSGAFTWTGSDAILTPTTHINTAQKRLSIMNLGSPWRPPSYYPGGSAATLRRVLVGHYSGFAATANAYTMTAQSGGFVWNGEPSFSDFEISCQSYAYTMTGVSITIIATRKIGCTAGVFTMTGHDANLTKFTGRTMVAVSGVFTETGQDANLVRPRGMSLESGSFHMGGRSINLQWYGVGNIPHPQNVPGGPYRGQLKYSQMEEDDLSVILPILEELLD